MLRAEADREVHRVCLRLHIEAVHVRAASRGRVQRQQHVARGGLARAILTCRGTAKDRYTYRHQWELTKTGANVRVLTHRDTHTRSTAHHN